MSLWETERRLWLEGADAYDDAMHPSCVMAFGPMGVMQGQEIIDALRQAPQWDEVTFIDRKLNEMAGRIAVLAYRAEAKRGRESYAALCTSTYAEKDGRWLLIQHQQTPFHRSEAHLV